MTNSADPDQLASSEGKGRVYLGSAGLGLMIRRNSNDVCKINACDG